MKKIVVLGAGQVGRAMAIDLCQDYAVTSADINEGNLAQVKQSHPVNTVKADLSSADEIKRVIADADLVIGAVPGFMGFKMVEAVLSGKKNIVDISFFNEDIFLLDGLAKQNNVV